jgi:hypothetical protein
MECLGRRSNIGILPSEDETLTNMREALALRLEGTLTRRDTTLGPG